MWAAALVPHREVMFEMTDLPSTIASDRSRRYRVEADTARLRRQVRRWRKGTRTPVA